MDEIEYTEEQKKAFAEAIWLGIVSLTALPKRLYTGTANVLKKSLYKGYGGTMLDFEFGSPDYELLKDLRENIYIFSGAKTATQVTDIQSLMMDGDKIRPLAEFKKLALEKFEVYNGKGGYLESEYITANVSANSAAKWQYAQQNKELFTRMKAMVIMDDLTAPECARMSGVVAAVDDPIWNHNIAPRHFRCRCHEELLDKYDKEPVTPKLERVKIMKENDAEMNPVFKMNPGKDRYVFSPKHAYFDIGKKFPVLARKNFGLKIPKTDAE